MIDIAKIKAQSARVKAIIAGTPYVAPVEPEVSVEPIVVPEIVEEVKVEPEIQVEPTEEYPLNQD